MYEIDFVGVVTSDMVFETFKITVAISILKFAAYCISEMRESLSKSQQKKKCYHFNMLNSTELLTRITDLVTMASTT